MVKSKKQMFIIIGLFTLLLFVGGTSYAWFTYRGETGSHEIVAGDIYLTMTEGNETLTLTNVFPETKEEARARNDNYITFSLNGLNESNKTIYYEILLNYGTSQPSPKSRYTDSDLVFDLVELDSNDNEVEYVVDARSYDSIINKRIWVDTINSNTGTNVSRKYKLRAWLSENVIISDSEANANYTTVEYPNKYASIKVAVNGDFTYKEMPSGVSMVRAAIEAKQNAQTNSCNPIWVDDNGTASDTSDDITYFSGTNDCVDMNYVWYSGKLWRITAIYPDGAMKLVTENNITSIAFNEEEQVDFYTDANTTSYMYQWLNEDFYDTLYDANNIIDYIKQWDMGTATAVSSQPSESVNISSNVGLLNSYEYYNSYRNLGSYSNGYLQIGYLWRLLNPSSALTGWCVYTDGANSYEDPSIACGVRPSIYLKSGLKFTGEGSKQSPYIIASDKDTGTANELVNTRISGEYVKLKNGNNEQVFRIIGVEDSKAKIIAMDYANNGTKKSFAINDGNANALWGSGTTTGVGTWYTYLNEATTGYFDTLKNTYGELFDSATYYLGTSGFNYKLGICANTTSGNTKVCSKTSDNAIYNIGLPRYGEMFATQQSGGFSNSITMWLMNRESTLHAWAIDNYNYGNSFFPSTKNGARPTVHLKSTVKILSGSGTEQDPYVVGL